MSSNKQRKKVETIAPEATPLISSSSPSGTGPATPTAIDSYGVMQSESAKDIIASLTSYVNSKAPGNVDENDLNEVNWWKLITTFVANVLILCSNLMLEIYVSQQLPTWHPFLVFVLVVIFTFPILVLGAALWEFMNSLSEETRLGLKLIRVIRGKQKLPVRFQDLYLLACGMQDFKEDSKGRTEHHRIVTVIDMHNGEPVKLVEIHGFRMMPFEWQVQSVTADGGKEGEADDLIQKANKVGTSFKDYIDGLGKEELKKYENQDFTVHLEMTRSITEDWQGFLQTFLEYKAFHHMKSIFFANLFLMPLIVFFWYVGQGFENYCDPTNQNSTYYGHRLCNGSEEPECEKPCGNILDFLNTLMQQLNISPIELSSTISLSLTFVWLQATEMTYTDFRALEIRYRLCNLDADEIRPVFDLSWICEACTGMLGAFELLRLMYKQLAHSNLDACGWLDDDALTGGGKQMLDKGNRVFNTLLSPYLDGVMLGRQFSEVPQKGNGRQHFLKCFSSSEFNVMTAVPIPNVETLEVLFEGFFKSESAEYGYKGQLAKLFETMDLADGANGGDCTSAAVKTRIGIGSIDIPPDMVLTHFAVFMNGDGKQVPKPNDPLNMWQMAIGKMSLDADPNNPKLQKVTDFATLFNLLKPGTAGTSVSDSNPGKVFSFFPEWPKVWLPYARNKQPAVPKDATSEFYMVLQISPKAYYAWAASEKQPPNMRSDFSAWLKYTFEDDRPPLLPAEHLPSRVKQSWDALEEGVVSEGRVRKKDDTSIFLLSKMTLQQKMLKLQPYLFRIFLYIVLLVLICGGFVLIVPMWRVMRGGELFPEPFIYIMACNCAFQWVCFAYFLYTFQYYILWLTLTKKLLKELEDRTMRPVSIKKDDEDETDPFDLTVGQTADYQPGTSRWNKMWWETTDNVEDWHKTVTLIRGFIAPSRLWVQATLGAASFLLLVLVLVSIVQALTGQGMVSVDSQALVAQVNRDTSAALASAAAAGNHLAETASQHITGGVNTAMTQAHDAATRRLTAGTGEEQHGDLEAASEDLRKALLPFRGSLREIMETQAATLATHRRRLQLEIPESARNYLNTVSIGDVSKITKAQFVTVIFVGILLFYTVWLVYTIASINSYIDRHESLLTKQKETHCLNQQKRTKALSSLASEKGDGPEGTSNADVACKRYEAMLDQCIESAKDNKVQYPIQLYGKTISFALLAQLVALGLVTVVQQGRPLITGELQSMCNALEHNDFINSMQGQLDESLGAVDSALSGGNISGSQGSHHLAGSFNIGSIIDSLICENIMSVAQAALDTTEAGLNNIAQGNNVTRRLRSGVSKSILKSTDDKIAALAPIVASAGGSVHRLYSGPELEQVLKYWWEAHPGDPAGKLLTARLLLADLRATAQRFLVATPAAVNRTFSAAGFGPALDIMGLFMQHEQDPEFLLAGSPQEL